MSFTPDAMSLMSRYFSYASMLIPSNDAFIANGNPLAFSSLMPLEHFSAPISSCSVRWSTTRVRRLTMSCQ